MSFETKTLLGVKKQQKPHSTFFRQMFFGREAFSDTKEIAIDKVVPNLRLAPFVSPVVAGKVRKQDGFKTTSYAPPYLKPKDAVEPGNMLYRMAGEAEGGEMSPAQRHQATVAFLLDDQELAIQRREEQMCVEAVLTGKYQVTGTDEHAEMEIDFNRTAANMVQLTGAARWSQLDKDTTDIAAVIATYADLSSGLPGVLIFDKVGFSKFVKFKGVLDALSKTVANGNSSLELGPQLKRDVQYKGNYGEYEVYVYAGYYEADDGAKVNYLPDDTMILIPVAYDGVMAYGAIQDSKANASGVAKAKRWPKNWDNPDPAVEYLMTQSAPLPILPDADEIVVVTIDGDA